MSRTDYDPAGARLDSKDRATRTLGFYSRLEHALRESPDERLREHLAIAVEEFNDPLLSPERRCEVISEIRRLRRLLGKEAR